MSDPTHHTMDLLCPHCQRVAAKISVSTGTIAAMRVDAALTVLADISKELSDCGGDTDGGGPVVYASMLNGWAARINDAVSFIVDNRPTEGT